MLRYYVYFYFCSAAITAYVGFLKLRFEEMDKGVFPAFEPTDEDRSSETELARTRVKRHTVQSESTIGDQLMMKIEEFRRLLQTAKLRKLQEQGPSGLLKFKAPLDKTVQEESSRTRKRRKRQTEAGTQVDREKGKKRVRRARKAKEKVTDAPAIHGAKNEKDLYLADPNAYFDKDPNAREGEEEGVQEGVANQMFVVHLGRTIGYFVLLQVVIFVILAFSFFTYGYYKYEMWKLKESKFYKTLLKIFSGFRKTTVGGTKDTQQLNTKMEAMQAKAEAEDEQRKAAIAVTMEKRDAARQLQETAQEIAAERRREREEAKGEGEEDEGKKKKGKGKKGETKGKKGKGTKGKKVEQEEKKGKNGKNEKAEESKDAPKGKEESDGKKKKSSKEKKDEALAQMLLRGNNPYGAGMGAGGYGGYGGYNQGYGGYNPGYGGYNPGYGY